MKEKRSIAKSEDGSYCGEGNRTKSIKRRVYYGQTIGECVCSLYYFELSRGNRLEILFFKKICVTVSWDMINGLYIFFLWKTLRQYVAVQFRLASSFLALNW